MSHYDIETRQLLAKMDAKYLLESHTFDLADHQIEMKVVADTDTLLDELIAKGPEDEDVADERIPYWADLWHSAIALAHWVFEFPAIHSDSGVLELGCGLGMSGIAAGLKGAAVVQTDYLPEALQMAELCWRLNLSSLPKTAILDWRNPLIDFQPDVLLAADVMYEERNGPPLLQAIKALLPRHGVMLLTEPGRPIGQDFLAQLPKEGFMVSRSMREVHFKQLKVKVHQAEIRWTH
ncbi:MAG: hypothetical protein AAF206_17115 [Bacteroidota bacterium]